jgi:hypothetical protein
VHFLPATSRSHLVRLATLTAAASTVLAALAPVAHATAHPSVPTGIHVSSATPTSFTVSMNAAPNVAHYRVFGSTTRSNVYVANTAHAHASAWSTSPNVTLSGLTSTAAAYNYVVETENAGYHAWSVIYLAGVQPATPTSLAVSSSTAGTYLTWSSGPATGAIVSQATNAALTSNRRDFYIRGITHTFTPYGMTPGVTYYYRVRARTMTSPSGYSSEVAAVIRSHAQSVRVMTYNILQVSADGTPEGGQTVASWSARRTAEINLIKQVTPDVLAVQEGGSWVSTIRGARQVDSLLSALGSTYSLARTEIPPNEPGYRRSGSYLLYRNAAFAETGHGGFWDLPYGSFAAYSVLRNRTSGAAALFVSAHLTALTGASYDSQRQAQMNAVITSAKTVAGQVHVPIVYAGDFNSNTGPVYTFDGPGIAARTARLPDAKDMAQSYYNSQYNSFNHYMRTAVTGSDDIDRIFGAPGVAVATWHVVLNLSAGNFLGTMGSDHNPLYSAMSYPY